jgi:hypothetical protein
MARPLVEITVNEKKLTGVLDTGAWRSYIRKELVKNLTPFEVEPFESKLGGQHLSINKGYLINGTVKDSENHEYRFAIIAYPAENIGEENGKKIDLLIGAIVLEDWGTVIDQTSIPPKVDYTRLRKGVLVEL